MVGLLRLLSLALFLLPAPFREYYLPSSSPSSSYRATRDDHAAGTGTAAGGGGEELRPIILFPGVSCSNLEARLTEAYRPSTPRCGAMKGKGWFGLWENSSDLAARDYVPCFLEQMRLVYDPAADDYRDLPGVETRVPGFGSAKAFYNKDPLKSGTTCLVKLRDRLESMGYRDGETLFGAPYDMRHAPPMPGHPSRVFSRYFHRLTELIEDITEKRNNKGVILLGHSYGGMVALEFVRSASPAWREEHVKHLVLVAPTLFEGFLDPVRNLASGPHMFYLPTTPTPASLRTLWWTWESAVMFLPSPAVYGVRDPVVVTRRRNYTASPDDMAALLRAIGVGAGVLRAFRRRAAPRMRGFEAPMVPVTCFNGAGVPTPRRLVYRCEDDRDDDFDGAPAPAWSMDGDGDGMINAEGMDAFDEDMRRDPEQRRVYRSVRLRNCSHETVLTDDRALNTVVHAILQANRIVLTS